MPLRRAAILCLAGLFVVLAAAGRVEAQAATPTELKAAYVLNFLRYTQWPAPPSPDGAPMEVVVIGSERFARVLRQLLQQSAIDGSGRIEVVRLPPATGRAAARRALKDARAVFIEASAWPGARALLSDIGGRAVLTVGDAPGFAREGGMIGLVQQGSRIVFDANPAAIRGSGLQVSAKVLKLARIVGPEAPS